MKKVAWMGTALILLVVALAIGVGLAQASPKQGVITPYQLSQWWFTNYIDKPGDVGRYTSIAFDPGNGTPWISYYDESNGDLKVAHLVSSGGNCGPGDKWYCETVDSVDDVGENNSIDVHPNTGIWPLNTRRIGVSYYDSTNGALKFAEYTCFMTCEWNIFMVDGPADDVYLYGRFATALKYDNSGTPRIAYHISSWPALDQLNYAKRVTSGGNCGVGEAFGKWKCELVETGEYLGSHASMDYSSYYGAAFAYYSGDGFLKFAVDVADGSGNCGTGNSFYCFFVDGMDGSDVGWFASIHVPVNSEDKLQFAYYDKDNGKLKYAAKATGGSGNCGGGEIAGDFQCDFIESVGNFYSGAGVSLAVNSKYVPIIAYADRSEPSGLQVLKIAQPADSLDLTYGNCGPEILFSTWQCTTIDGGIYKDEAQYTSIALDPNGRPMIAYSELVHETLPYEYNLKIAQLLDVIFLPVVLK